MSTFLFAQFCVLMGDFSFHSSKGNWGAVVASVGACGVSVNPDKMSVWLHKGSEQDEGRETVNLLQSGKLIPVSVERCVRSTQIC